MSGDTRSLRATYAEAGKKRNSLADLSSTISDQYQETLASAIASYEQCIRIANDVSLFSTNETLEDITSSDIQYLLLRYQLADLLQKITQTDRKTNISQAQANYEKFLKVLDQYDLLSRDDAKLLEAYHDNPTRFSTASTSDPVARRAIKIQRFKEEKELRTRLEYLQQNPSALANDDEALRELQLAHVKYAIHMTFQSLESIAQELQILAMAPPTPSQQPNSQLDPRQRQALEDGYSERLDMARSALTDKKGPILDKSGRPIRPFTLLDKRAQLRDGVFRPDHSLPTMSIDEYLDEERKRGGMIEGGGAASGIRPEVDENDYDKADEETYKARAWDEYKEANTKGSGNTMNMG